MSAAELEAEASSPDQQAQQQAQQGQQGNETTSTTTTAIEETAHYNNNDDIVDTQMPLANMQMQQQMDGNNSNGMTGLGMSLMNSSPPPHSYRHSRAYRHFKNPPQPHMCIRTTTEAGEELFINVLSWTRIVIPQEPSDPIPLYGGMRVPPGSPRSPPIVFAVMANPEVLKDSGRHSKDPEERRAMVELMCDFVEAMNPGVKLVRNALILKDRDISGELKDVWNAVQAQRDREREEQMLQQRQQQHYQNITTQQMFPKSPDAVRAASASGAAMMEGNSPPAALGEPLLAEQGNGNSPGNGNGNGITLAVFAQQLDNKVASEQSEQELAEQESRPLEEACVDQTDAGSSVNGSTTTPPSPQAVAEPEPEVKVAEPKATNGTAAPVSVPVSAAPVSASPAPAPAPITPAPTPPPAAPAKKEKLGGFLPNGCIFPRFKNNKNKDKDGGSHKEGKSKEKTLLNALKKSKEKKVAPSEQPVEKANASDNGTTQYEKNCINNLECEVQKLDLNSGSNGDNGMFIKLTAAAAAK
ncbi:uncharacterized protein Dana_GF23735 [Drosophila ananassae]|uniref:PIH1 N-terminal domain-containing protein n=1 Tax=Drosophila ananassae TaxID=7217 RepID=B3M6F8_DROAN|nr:uncharacterized protein LOC6506374 [Drosophila ananassae]EDV40807.1 uncharacterized protein Dana_GF23735 [Drosophila ananassae]